VRGKGIWKNKIKKGSVLRKEKRKRPEKLKFSYFRCIGPHGRGWLGLKWHPNRAHAGPFCY